MKTLSYKQDHTPKFLSSRLLLSISFVIVIPLYVIVSITNAYAAQVTLAWDQNTESNLAGYKIYYGNSSRKYTRSVDVKDRTATTCTISDLIEGQTYYFAATAYNTSGSESNYSAEVIYPTDPETTSVPTPKNPLAACQHKAGDLDSNGMVTINEQVAVVRMYLGLDPVNSLSDIDNDGVVQIWDVMKVTNCYLENVYCLCLG